MCARRFGLEMSYNYIDNVSFKTSKILYLSKLFGMNIVFSLLYSNFKQRNSTIDSKKWSISQSMLPNQPNEETACPAPHDVAAHHNYRHHQF